MPRSPQWSISLRFPHQDPIRPPSPHLYAPHAQPISFFSILSPAQYWVSSTDQCTYIVFNNLQFTLKHLKCSYVFRSHDNPQGAYFVDRMIETCRSVLSVFNVNFRLLRTIYMQLLVRYWNKLQNAWCNDKDSNNVFTMYFTIYCRHSYVSAPHISHQCLLKMVIRNSWNMMDQPPTCMWINETICAICSQFYLLRHIMLCKC